MIGVTLSTDVKPVQRYRDLNTYLKTLFGERVQKISLDAGMSCPNRDGTLSRKGCIYCDARGAGTGAFIHENLSIEEQIARSKKFLTARYGARKFIAYFQSFTNTYAAPARLKALYDEAVAQEDVVGLSVATRPDCLDTEKLDLLASYGRGVLVWLELGLQSSHDQTLTRINRGHDASCFEKAVRMARLVGLPVCAHVILGLPGENRQMMLHTARYLSGLPVAGVKIHLLYVVKGTPLAALFEKGRLRCLDQETYANLVVDFLERLPPRMVIHRLTGDPPKTELLAPLWAKDKTKTLNLIKSILEKRNTHQGRLYDGQGG